MSCTNYYFQKPITPDKKRVKSKMLSLTGVVPDYYFGSHYQIVALNKTSSGKQLLALVSAEHTWYEVCTQASLGLTSYNSGLISSQSAYSLL